MVIKHLLVYSLYLISSFTFASELILGTSTSTDGSGLLKVLIPAFEKDSGDTIKSFAVGTGTALRMARQGKVDVLIVHAPESEEKFVQQGYGILRTPLMHNDFILIGPKTDPANIRNLKDVSLAFKKIQQSNSLFISRADDSGTHKKEKSIWKNANLTPYGEWYFELGAGISKALIKSNTKKAYTLVDRGTWLAKRKSIDLVLHVEGDPLLLNPYHVIATNPVKHKNINHKVAKKFIKWLTGNKGQSIINNLQIDDEKLFTGILP